jgi:hypothetical protein
MRDQIWLPVLLPDDAMVSPIYPIAESCGKGGIHARASIADANAILAVAHTKGGVGKSTLAFELAQMRAKAGHDVWLVDADPQGSALTAATAPPSPARAPPAPLAASASSSPSADYEMAQATASRAPPHLHASCGRHPASLSFLSRLDDGINRIALCGGTNATMNGSLIRVANR